MNTTLAKLDQATRMLARIKTVDDAKKIVNLAEAARVYAREVELGLEAQNHAAEIKIRAQRRGGEILIEMAENGQRSNGGRPEKPIHDESVSEPTLSDLGIEKNDAIRWQSIAALPIDVFEAVITETREAEKELTTAAMLREVQVQKRQADRDQLSDVDPPTGKYRVLYADPPWHYNDAGVINESDGYGHAERHYPTMTIEQLCLLPIGEMADDDAVLFLWTTSPMLEDSFKVIAAWGFEYKTSFVWDKVKHNFGHYNSVRHEFLLICTRGSCIPDASDKIDSVQMIERSDRHSEKPEEFRAIIDRLYTSGNRIELFARSQHEGWDTWGNEV